MKQFTLHHLVFKRSETVTLERLSMRYPAWFFKKCIAPLEVGEHVDTDFNRITRLPDNNEAEDES